MQKIGVIDKRLEVPNMSKIFWESFCLNIWTTPIKPQHATFAKNEIFTANEIKADLAIGRGR
jgi:hypothetical protein